MRLTEQLARSSTDLPQPCMHSSDASKRMLHVMQGHACKQDVAWRTLHHPLPYPLAVLCCRSMAAMAHRLQRLTCTTCTRWCFSRPPAYMMSCLLVFTGPLTVLQNAREADPNAILRLAKMYLHGQGCQRNIALAQEWVRKAR